MLELDEIQSEIVCGYKRRPRDTTPKHGAYVLVRFEDRDATRENARAFLQAFPPTFASAWDPERTRINVGLTYRALRLLLGLPEAETLAAASEAFEELRETMAQRSAVLGDAGPSSAETWTFSDGDTGKGFVGAHAVLMIFGPTVEGVKAVIDRAVEHARRIGAAYWVEKGTELDGGREHFGYVDGISQPAFEGIVGPVDGHGAVGEDEAWRPIKPGELVLGYEDEEGPFGGAELLRNGTFFVLRKLEQNVPAFREYLEENARVMGETPEWLAARVMGRDYDGVPLSDSAVGLNGFRYGPDNDGFQCPHAAHIRRANPRDASGRPGDRSERHRMVRRTLAYAYDDGGYVHEEHSFGYRLRYREEPSDEEKRRKRGLLFGAFNASIGRQFEIVQGSWINGGGNAPTKLFTLRDALAGANDAKGTFIIPGRPPRIGSDLKSFVTTRGGAYFFVPGKRTLAAFLAPEERDNAGLLEREKQVGASRKKHLKPPKSRFGWLSDKIARATSGWRHAGGAKDAEDENPPEEQVLLLMAPFPKANRGALCRELAKTTDLDRELSELASDLGQSIHHARFAVVDTLHRWPEKGADEAVTPEPVPLPGDDPYLLFACWFDGPRAALTAKLGDRAKHLPFKHCYAFPKAGSSARRFRRFVEEHRIPPLLVYCAYNATTSEIREGLGLRGTFVAMLQRIQQLRAQAASGADRDVRAAIDGFLAALGQPSLPAKRAK